MRRIALTLLIVCVAAMTCEAKDVFILTVGPADVGGPATIGALLKEIESTLPKAKRDRRIVAKPARKVVLIATQFEDAKARIEASLRSNAKLKIVSSGKAPQDALKDR